MVSALILRVLRDPMDANTKYYTCNLSLVILERKQQTIATVCFTCQSWHTKIYLTIKWQLIKVIINQHVVKCIESAPILEIVFILRLICTVRCERKKQTFRWHLASFTYTQAAIVDNVERHAPLTSYISTSSFDFYDDMPFRAWLICAMLHSFFFFFPFSVSISYA